MAGVVLGQERLCVDPSDREWLADEGVWRFRFPYAGRHLEILLAGNAGGPDGEALALAERVGAQVDPFVAVGIDYLRSFVVGTDFDGTAQWWLEWLEFGLKALPDLRWPFKAVFLRDDDSYGVWSVIFADAGERVGFLPWRAGRTFW